MTIWYTKVVNAGRNIPYKENGAPGKSRQDVYQFFKEIGANELNLFTYKYEEESIKSLNIRFDGILGGLKKGDVVIQLVPHLTNSKIYQDVFKEKVHSFEASFVGYVHDIEFFRHNMDNWDGGDGNIPFRYTTDFDKLARYDALIVPTANMKKLIREDFEFTGPITVAGPYGYITPQIPNRRQKENLVTFAGSFDKNASLKKLVKKADKINFNLYGASASGKNMIHDYPNASFKGMLPVDTILILMEGSYGLIWDSLDYPDVIGGVGLYQYVNGPYKLSMNLAAELPVIIWSESAFADYVVKNNVGWAIDDLSQLQDLILTITEEDYQSKLDSLEVIGGLVREGIQLKKSVFEVVTQLNEKSTYEREDNILEKPIGINNWVIEFYNRDTKKFKEFDFNKDIINHYKNSDCKDSRFQEARKLLIKTGKI